MKSRGASLAARAGFAARAWRMEAAPTWKGIVQAADEHNARLIEIATLCRFFSSFGPA